MLRRSQRGPAEYGLYFDRAAQAEQDSLQVKGVRRAAQARIWWLHEEYRLVTYPHDIYIGHWSGISIGMITLKGLVKGFHAMASKLNPGSQLEIS